MEQGHEASKFVSSRVAERISENPVLATFVLDHLVQAPEPTKEESKTYTEDYGADFTHMHAFLSGVIGDLNTYLEVDVPEEAAQAADADPGQQERINKLRSGRIEADEKKRLTLSNRANQLRAMARISVQKAIEDQANYQLEEVN